MKKKILSVWLALTMSVMLVTGCSGDKTDAMPNAPENATAENGSAVNNTAADVPAAGNVVSAAQADLKNAAQINLAKGSVIISKAGTYVLSGTLEDGQIVVDADKETEVVLVLNGIDITCSNSAAIRVKKAKTVTILAQEGTVNKVSDGKTYSAEAVSEEITGAIFSKADLEIGGNGTLEVSGNYKHGIVSKDNLLISDVTLKVTATTDCLHGKDSVQITSGTFELTAGGDAIQSDNDKDEGLGYLRITGGDFTVSAEEKGLKAETKIMVTDGKFELETEDDSIHCNGDIIIEGGSFTIRTGDDGVHADANLTINGGNILIQKSYEGLEGKIITINGGNIELTSSDDGINAAGGNSSDMRMGRFGADSFAEDGEIGIVINGGTIVINASGDGIDSNQSLEINGGEIYVNGPTSNADAALDFEARYGGFINGGLVAAFGSSGMVESMSDESKQCSLTVFMDTTVAAGTVFSVLDNSGKVLIEFTPAKSWQCAILSHPDMKEGKTYTVKAGETSVEVTLEGRTTVSGQANRGGFGNRGNGGKGDFGGMPGDFNFGDMPGDFKPDDLPEGFDFGGRPGSFKKGDMPDGFNPEDMQRDFNPENRKNFKENSLT